MDRNFKANDLLLWLAVIFTIAAVFYGAYLLLRFDAFDIARVDKFLQVNSLKCRSFVIGHRGSMLEAPENTLVGIRYAAEKGADAVEFDVDFTKDGHAILMHDATVDRTTDGSGRVGDFTLDEIKKLNALGDFKERFVKCLFAFYVPLTPSSLAGVSIL